MQNGRALATHVSVVLAASSMGAACNSTTPPPPDPTHGCASSEPLRQPFFGDTHVHSSYSFDSYVFSVRNDPDAAYRFAKGEAVTLPGELAVSGVPQTRAAQLSRPLDFAAVTDHAELLGEMQICTRDSEGTPGQESLACQQMLTEIPDASTVAAEWALNPLVREETAKNLPFCGDEDVDCASAAVSMWQDIQRAAEAHYDRTEACTFTTFIAYEFTAQPSWDNLHRNVIFRNEKTVASPITNVTIDGTQHLPELWRLLGEQCVNAGNGCDVLTIPHNPNLSGSTENEPLGRMFATPESTAEAKERAFYEPLVEIIQHKGASECRYDRIAQQGVQTVDELCTFEQIVKNNLAPTAPDIPIQDFPLRDVVRNALKDGMVLASEFGGVNPFKYGIVGSTDTHNGTPGNTPEETFQGHAGTEDAPLANLIDGIYRGPGGLAVVWAEENTRESIFDAMRRKETYGTSGTRPTVRFFGGWKFDTSPDVLCASKERVARGYAEGVPMGSDLPPRTNAEAPRFLVAAAKDAGTATNPGTPLQRIQIIKGWVDAEGKTHEDVLNVVGNTSTTGTEVDPATCGRDLSAGFGELCTVWEDTSFDPALPAFYYARVLENPSCRWSTYQCRAADVDPFLPEDQCLDKAAIANQKAIEEGVMAEGDTNFNNCCLNETNNAFLARTLQERAWTSPIWYVPTP